MIKIHLQCNSMLALGTRDPTWDPGSPQQDDSSRLIHWIVLVTEQDLVFNRTETMRSMKHCFDGQRSGGKVVLEWEMPMSIGLNRLDQVWSDLESSD